MEFTRCYSCMRALNRPGAICPKCGYDNTTGPKAQPGHALPCGTVLARRYVVGKVLGQGGFGITYVGFNLSLETPVCIKEYFPVGGAMRSAAQSRQVCWGGGESAEELRRGRESFVREARKAAKLQDLSAVVKVWDVFYENETAYIVMNYIKGETLKSHLVMTGRALTEAECAELLTPVIRELGEIHARGIVHRDISPDNLMLGPDGKLVLLDLGAAKDLSGGSGQSSVIVAKQGFSPLEQYNRRGSIGPWTDVYAICATMVWCMSGKLLPSPMERFSGEELDLSAFSPAVRAALEKGLAIYPKDRIQSMGELLEGLHAALRPEAPEKKQEAKKPGRLPIILAAALLMALVFFGGGEVRRAAESGCDGGADGSSRGDARRHSGGDNRRAHSGADVGADTCTHADADTRTYTCTHTRADAGADTCTHAGADTRTHTRADTGADTCTHAGADTSPHADADAYPCADTPSRFLAGHERENGWRPCLSAVRGPRRYYRL